LHRLVHRRGRPPRGGGRPHHRGEHGLRRGERRQPVLRPGARLDHLWRNLLMRAVTITLAALGALGCTPLLGEHEPPTLQVDAGTDAASQDSCEGVATELRCEVEGATCSERTLTVCSRDASGCLRVERTDCGATGETCDAAAAACAPCHGPEACSFERRCDGGDLVTCGP